METYEIVNKVDAKKIIAGESCGLIEVKVHYNNNASSTQYFTREDFRVFEILARIKAEVSEEIWMLIEEFGEFRYHEGANEQFYDID